MAHGTRGRLALLGTGLLVCLGCMEPDPKPISKAPMKGPLGLNAKSNPPAGGALNYGGGMQPAGFNTPARPNGAGDAFGRTPTAGAMSPPMSVIPPTAPPTGPYTNTGLSQPNYSLPGDLAQPPSAPGVGGYPQPPVASPGAVNPYGK